MSGWFPFHCSHGCPARNRSRFQHERGQGKKTDTALCSRRVLMTSQRMTPCCLRWWPRQRCRDISTTVEAEKERKKKTLKNTTGVNLLPPSYFLRPHLRNKLSLSGTLANWWQDPNTYKVQRTLFIRVKHNLQIFGVIPFIELQSNT